MHRSRPAPCSKRASPPPAAPSNADEEDEDDYMNMTFTEAPSQPETSLQRRQRLRREGEIAGRVKSKAELAAEAEAQREAALSKSLLEDAKAKKSKGFAMMAKMGFKGGALGPAAAAGLGNQDAKPDGGKDGDAAQQGSEAKASSSGGVVNEHGKLVEPLRINVKDGREGIGLESERKRKLREAAEQAGEAAKRARVDEHEYRDRVRREREEARAEKIVRAAQKAAERMDEESNQILAEDGKDADQKGPKKAKGAISSRPLKSIPLVWRGLVRERELAERDRRMRHDLEQGLSRLPTYEDDDQDDDDKRALGKDRQTVYAIAEDLDEKDEELDKFEALEALEKLRQVVLYLREKHRYCFWCKFTYPDEDLEGCPGLAEEDHD